MDTILTEAAAEQAAMAVAMNADVNGEESQMAVRLLYLSSFSSYY